MTLAEKTRLALENNKNISRTDTSGGLHRTSGDLGRYSKKKIETCAIDVYVLIFKTANN